MYLFVQVPISVNPTSTTSQSTSQTGLGLPRLIPAGLQIDKAFRRGVHMHRRPFTHVPVKITSPGCNVIPIEKKDTICATPKIMLPVVSFCFITPLTLVVSWSFCGSGMMLVETIAGPHGPQPSASLPIEYWGSGSPPRSICHPRWETSLPTLYPKTWSSATSTDILNAFFLITTTNSPS